jgi:excisionase family DNA binding protein
VSQPSPEAHERAFYTVREFCYRNSIGKTLFYELVQDGTIPTVKVGRRTLIPAVAEREWHAKILAPQPTKPSAQSHKISHKRSADGGGLSRRTADN